VFRPTQQGSTVGRELLGGGGNCDFDSLKLSDRRRHCSRVPSLHPADAVLRKDKAGSLANAVLSSLFFAKFAYDVFGE